MDDLTPQPVMKRLIIATRESRLAWWQAQHVQALLCEQGHQVSLLGMTTQGDQIQDRPLSQVGGKSLFVKELEMALQEGHADLAVHSLKDVPMTLPTGMTLACVMQRDDPLDAWVSPRYATLNDLPDGAVVGTSSLRRMVMLRALRPDLHIEPLRGNVDTRLRKLDEGALDGIVLAAVGLKRLGLQARIREVFEPQRMLPAAAQGALGIEVRSDRTDVVDALIPLAHHATWLAVAAERALVRALGAGCSAPLAAFATFSTFQQDVLTLDAVWGDPEGLVDLVRVQQSATVTARASAEALGHSTAHLLRLRVLAEGGILPDMPNVPDDPVL